MARVIPGFVGKKQLQIMYMPSESIHQLEAYKAELELSHRKSMTEYLIRIMNSGCPRQIKDEAILAMFSQDFKIRATYHPLERKVFEVLRRDGDIFKLIENLVMTINELQDNLREIHKA